MKKIFIVLGIVILVIFLVFFLLKISFKNIAEKQKVYQIGLLQMASTVNANIEGFKEGMKEFGYIEGKNVVYYYRNAEGKKELLPEFVKEFIQKKVDLIFTNTSPATQAAKEGTENTEIPVVFSMVADPLRAGFVKSLKSSGNNLTGTSCAYIEIAPKRLEILKEIAPKIKKVLVFYRPEDKSGGPATEAIIKTAPLLGLTIDARPIKSLVEIEENLKNLKQNEVDALMDPADSMVTAALPALLESSFRLKIPLLMLSEEEAQKGALASYGVDYFDLGKQTARLAAQVLEGRKPSEIPIEPPRKFYFVINLKTAKALGIEIPESVLVKANKIIE